MPVANPLDRRADLADLDAAQKLHDQLERQFARELIHEQGHARIAVGDRVRICESEAEFADAQRAGRRAR